MIKTRNATLLARILCVALFSAGLLSLSGCGNKDSKPGQTLVRVNGDEITVHQLNEELGRNNIPPSTAGNDQSAQKKKILDALVDRQLLVGEAMRNKLDRDPNVMQALERTKSQILAQAYLQSKTANGVAPTKEEAETYYQAHPNTFAQRKIFDMKQLVIASTDFNSELSTLMNNAKSLDEAIAWLDERKIVATKSEALRSSADLPPQIVEKMQGADKTQLFILKDANKTIMMSLAYLKDSPVPLQTALPEISQFLANKKNQETAEAELQRLRTAAKIEYLNLEAVGLSNDKSPAVSNTAGKEEPTAKAPEKAGPDLTGFK